MLTIITLPARHDNYIYLAHDTLSKQTVVIDPAEAEPVLAALQHYGWQLDYIFNTHHHDDHIHGNQKLKQYTSAKIVAAYADRLRIPDIDIAVNDGDRFLLGDLAWQVIATPGHTLNHIIFYNPQTENCFVGDTLFAMGCGRLFEGSAAQMWQSLQKIKNLPASTKIYCAHEYTQANGRFALSIEADNLVLVQRMQEVDQLRREHLSTLPSTIALELATNPFFRENSLSIRKYLGFSEQDDAVKVFAKIRTLKDSFL